MQTYHGIEEIDVDSLTACDLRSEAAAILARGQTARAGRVILLGDDGYRITADVPQVLYCPETDRGGVTWGGNAEWYDGDNIDAVARQHFAPMIADQSRTSKAARILGQRGGLAGRGASQRRGDSAHYVALAAMRKRPGRKPKKIECGAVYHTDGSCEWTTDKGSACPVCRARVPGVR
jgi:hypothetical protein